MLVELGPFLPCTGTSCFRWAVDTELLRHGPREFRINTTDRALPNATVAALVEDVVDRWRRPYPPYTEVLNRVLLAASANADQQRRYCIYAAAALAVLGGAVLAQEKAQRRMIGFGTALARTTPQQNMIGFFTLAASAAAVASIQVGQTPRNTLISK